MSTPSLRAIGPWRFMRLLFCRAFFIMIGLIFIEAVLGATVTYFVIQAGKDIANNDFKIWDFAWILFAQGGSYVLHGVSWIYGERAGFGAFSRYIGQFGRENRHSTGLLHDKPTREQVEPFLTSEAFHLLFELMYELEGALQLFFGLLLSALVIGMEIDEAFPLAYVVIFACVMLLQWSLRRRVTRVYLTNQRMTNRLTAQTYTAWDNVFAGNLYNWRLWSGRFKARLRDALRAQINAILLRESLSAVSGIFGLIVIFATMAWVVTQDSGNLPLLVALAATLPKQMSMTHDVHALAIGWNDLIALWTRASGVADNMQPTPPADLPARVKFERLTLREGPRPGAGLDGAGVPGAVAGSGGAAAGTTMDCGNLADALAIVRMHPTGRINVRGHNGAGKSTLLLALKVALRGQAYFWPTADRLAFAFSAAAEAHKIDEDADEDEAAAGADSQADAPSGAQPDVQSAPQSVTQSAAQTGYSSGETQIRALQEIVSKTRASVYLLDEWDANLDAANRAKAWALIDQLAARARVIEISHRDV